MDPPGGDPRGPFRSRGPSLKVQLYYTPDFSTVNRRVLMFTKEAKSVHKICDFSPGTGADGKLFAGEAQSSFLAGSPVVQ